MTEEQNSTAEEGIGNDLENGVEMISIGGEMISLADLAGIDTTEIEENRGGGFPAGHFDFEILVDPLPSLTKEDVKDWNDPNPDATVSTAVARFALKCIGVRRVAKPLDGSNAPSPESLIDRNYFRTFKLMKAEDLGKLVAFISDVGQKSKGALSEQIVACAGLRFSAVLTESFNRDNKDQTFVTMHPKKIEALVDDAAE